jgi:hypothetical protein
MLTGETAFDAEDEENWQHELFSKIKAARYDK